jgi:hypothetical protein
MSIRDPEQLRADIARWAREIRTWRAAGLTDEHPNIKRRLNRIALAQHLLTQQGVTVTDWTEVDA